MYSNEKEIVSQKFGKIPQKELYGNMAKNNPTSEVD